MSTNKTSTTTNQYDSESMTRYQGAQNSLYSQANSLWSNPFGNSMYTMGLQMQGNAANQLGMNNTQNAMSNFNMSGMGNLTGGARASLMSSLGRQNSGLRQQGFMSNFGNAQSNMWNAASVLGSMQPLETGQTNVSKTSGLGTWLPQVAGAAIGGLTGGLGSMLGSKMGGGDSGGNDQAGLGMLNSNGSNGLYGPGFGSGGSMSSVGNSGYFSNQNFSGGSGTPWAIRA